MLDSAETGKTRKVTKIECAYQDIFETKQLLCNIRSSGVYDETMHRLVISEDPGDEPYQYPELFSSLPLKIDWIIFSAKKTEESQRNLLGFWYSFLSVADGLLGINHYSSLSAFGDDKLYYLITQDLHDLQKVNESSLWETGPGLALPLENKENPELIKEATRVQLTAPNNLYRAIKLLFKCAIVTRHDGDGVEIIWADDWCHSEVMKKWALRIAKEYAAEGWNPY